MKYTRDNIEGLRVRRGGTTEYLIKKVFSSTISIKIPHSSYSNPFSLEKALIYLNNGRWTVVEGKIKGKIKELVYEIY